MMPEHKYITERFERRTYIKGTFKGKFIGDLDRHKSDEKHERFFNIEITEGVVVTTYDNIIKWPNAIEPDEFKSAAKFPVRNSGRIEIVLGYYDNSVKHFEVRLHEIKLLNCRLSHHDEDKKDVYGTIEGDILGYILHYDSIVEEVVEVIEVQAPPILEPSVSTDSKITPVPTLSILSRIKKIMRSAFGKGIYEPYEKSGCLSVFSFLFGLFFLIGILVIIRHPFLVVLCILIAILIIPRLYHGLARRFNFTMSVTWATILCYGLLGIGLFFLIKYYLADRQNGMLSIFAPVSSTLKDTLKRTNAKKDSLSFYLDEAKELQIKNKNILALQKVQQASLFASPFEIGLINTQRNMIFAEQAEKFISEGKYLQAIPIYTDLIRNAANRSNFFYNRAVCFIGSRRVQEAVTDLKRAIELGNKSASVLHDKINPIIKQVRLVTLCIDGTTSHAEGQGACSHHGGVKKWKHAVYEESRQYN